MPATPAYQRVINDIRSRITSGEWAPGYQLPPPDDLAVRYRTAWRIGVSGATVRRATDTLQTLGVLYGRQGVGVFVADDPQETGG